MEIDNILKRLSLRYLCGNGALTSSRKVTRLGLITEQEGLTKNQPVSKLLNLSINRFEDCVSQFHTILNRGYSTERFLKAHNALAPNDKAYGRFRTADAWIGGRDIDSARFVAPRHTKLEFLVKTLWQQFEQSPKHLADALQVYKSLLDVHPFKDGNGRVARAFLQAYALINENNPIHPDMYRLGRQQDEFINALNDTAPVTLQKSSEIQYWSKLNEWRHKAHVDLTNIFEDLNKSITAKLALTPLNNLGTRVISYISSTPCFCPITLQFKLNAPQQELQANIAKLRSAGIVKDYVCNESSRNFLVSEIVLAHYQKVDSYFEKTNNSHTLIKGT